MRRLTHKWLTAYDSHSTMILSIRYALLSLFYALVNVFLKSGSKIFLQIGSLQNHFLLLSCQ
jgi:hypothetical protein